MIKDTLQTLGIPQKSIGPVAIVSEVFTGEVAVPLATYESPLWPSTQRGALVAKHCGGIKAAVVREGMTRSVVVETHSLNDAIKSKHFIENHQPEISQYLRQTSRFANLTSIHTEVVGCLLYIRLCMQTGDASGHNMVTKAADAFLKWLLQAQPHLTYVSISANFCTDKKTSAINGILGRGKHVVAEVSVPQSTCTRILKTTPKAIVDLHTKKNLLGGILAGSTRSANAHFANILLAFYLATGQDAANIVEGSQGIVHCDIKNEALYFSVSLPNLIMGTVGNGKAGKHQQANLAAMGCLPDKANPGKSAQKLALIAASAVLCGELSLLAAQTNQGELMAAHEKYERANSGDLDAS